uniref:Serine aminopeptidase S33 domain-containing protein n=1 Tax=Araucaria cunninghamii TaxID=56994 RepID=A0A0D6R0B7_ARACU
MFWSVSMISLRSPRPTEARIIPVGRASGGDVYCARGKLRPSVEIKTRNLRLNLVMMATTRDDSTVILTSGASGRVNALFSLGNLRRLIFSVQALFLWILMLFERRKSCENTEEGKNQVSYRRSLSVRKFPIVRRRNVRRDEEEDVCKRRTLAVKSREFEGSGWKYYLFLNSRGETLFVQSWTPVFRNVKALLVLLHGLNEHSGRYKIFARRLNARGYKVYGIDWIGHGGSDGLHGYVPSLDEVVEDTKLLLQKIRSENQGMPCFLFGHSTGGSIILKAALDPNVKEMIRGIVLTSPALRVWTAHPIFGAIAPLFSLLLPRYQFSAANKQGTAVSRDPEALIAKYSDPLVYTGPIRVRTGSEILRICSYLQQNMKRVSVPFLVLHGIADTVTDPNASQDLYDQAASEHKAIKLYDGLLHDLLFEPEQDEIASDILKWMDDRLEH